MNNGPAHSERVYSLLLAHLRFSAYSCLNQSEEEEAKKRPTLLSIWKVAGGGQVEAKTM